MARKEYYYYRNGCLHHVHEVNEAVKVTEAESEQIKAEFNVKPYDKSGICEDFWKFLVGNKGSKPFEFREYMDKHCAEVRAYYRQHPEEDKRRKEIRELKGRTEDENTGNNNKGSSNYGAYNIGNKNKGRCNKGNYNIGCYNNGDGNNK